MDKVVVVGSSLAGVRACGGLRANGFDGQITLVGNEPHQPYDRPPLSKKVLAGDWEPERIALFRDGEIESLRLDLRLGQPAVGLSLADRAVELASGETVGFDGLIIATGAATRRLPQQLEDDSVFELRTLDDSLALRARLASGDQRVTIIGAGFIGLEVAATARTLGNEVVVVEGLPAPLIRGLGAEMGRAVTTLHDDHGVAIRCGVSVGGISRDGAALTVHITDGQGASESIASDIVVVGIGVSPVTGWLADSGLEVRDGIVCDATLNAGPVGVYAAGDVARWPNGQFDGEEMRVEHWTNASEQGLHAAKNLVAVADGSTPEPYSAVPFFWSEQYGARIQFIGRAAGDDEVRIVKGSVEDRAFVALYGKHGRLRGALGLSMPKPLMQCRKLVLERLSFDDAVAAVAAFSA
ncbi:MAG: ferredoxin reductase [Ilumatobacteraceae bacterium]|nr:ferredoxin reductase [Ilumatobacteraceae bacterium]